MDAFEQRVHRFLADARLIREIGIVLKSQPQPEGVSFRLTGGQLFADGAEEGTPVSLYNLQGVCVAKTAVQNGAISLEGLNKGVYAVQLGKLGSTLIRL